MFAMTEVLVRTPASIPAQIPAVIGGVSPKSSAWTMSGSPGRATAEAGAPDTHLLAARARAAREVAIQGCRIMEVSTSWGAVTFDFA